MTAGQAVRAAREANGYTQQQLADAAGITRGNLARIECGARPDVGSDILARIAAALGVTLALGGYEITATETTEAHEPRA